MTAIADDFDALAARMKERQREPKPKCEYCDDIGFVECLIYGTWRTCEACRNPEDLPCP
jgi:hypothetical protein